MRSPFRRTVAALLTFVALALAPSAHAQDSTQAAPAPLAVAPPRLGGYIQFRETYQHGPGLAATINRARLSAEGALPNRFTYRTLVEFEAGGNARTAAAASLREAYVRWTRAPFGVQFGQFKTPFSREYLVPVSALETLDLATVVDSLAPKYDIGFMAEYSRRGDVTLQAGFFNGEGQNIPANRDSAILFVARATARPLSQVTLGGSYARYSPDSLRYGADLSLEQSGVTARGEFIGQRKRGRARDDLGWAVFASVRVLPWLTLTGRQEDFQRPGIAMKRRISSTLGGMNVDLPGGRTRAIVNLVSTKTGFPRVQRNTLAAQLQVRF